MHITQAIQINVNGNLESTLLARGCDLTPLGFANYAPGDQIARTLELLQYNCTTGCSIQRSAGY